jgi:hypothetical protein
MIKRKLDNVVRTRLANFPAVALLGPRQVGKTTLARTLSNIYFDLEMDADQVRLDLQWPDIAGSKQLVILDEAQNYPEIFPRIRHAIDADRDRNGRFLILGSVSPELMTRVSEILTGRIAICELAPLSFEEIDETLENRLWLMGGYPDGGLQKKGNFPVWQQDYLQLLAMRDLPSWGLPAKPQTTIRFFKMLAASHGQVWNASQIGKSLGVSYHTANTYLDYLQQAYLLRSIPPYSVNIRKRLVKSPKVYWRDSGLLHTLLNVGDLDSLLSQPWAGLSWEGWVIEQIVIFLHNNDIHFDGPYYFRTRDGLELDLILIISGELWGIEIKLTTNPGPGDIAKLKKTASWLNTNKVALISRTKESVTGTDIFSTNLRGFCELLHKFRNGV